MKTLSQQLETAQHVFYNHFKRTPAFIAHAPGRINTIGEHTDYNQGLSMPCAINRWVTVSVLPSEDRWIHIYSEDFNGELLLEWGTTYEPKTSWEQYVYGCLQLFYSSVPFTSGFKAVISGNVPIGSGVSSSAALEVAFVNALNRLSGGKINELDLILLCQQVEHQYLHVKSGLLDQYASQFSKANHFMLLDFMEMSHRYIPSDTAGYIWVLCDSKVQRTLAGSKYSERVMETQQALSAVQQNDPNVRTFRDLEEKHLLCIENVVQKKRIRHYISENKRVMDAIHALAEKDLETFGTLLTSSHLSLRDDYEVSCPELDFLVEQAIALPSCLGSRMMGGGFGGCSISLVREDQVSAFGDVMHQAYLKYFDKETEINVYQSVDGAGVFPVLKNVQHSS
ncbi:MAG: galK [Chitinophagaceae bacterium]|nr:galK [Chitinophagaceae bacterium]